MAKVDQRAPFEIGGEIVAPGARRRVDIPISLLSTHAPMNLSVQVIHGRRDGPVVFVSGAVHGDEIIGVEIIRRLARSAAIKRIAGTLLLVPVVNLFGFIGNSRYLPDRRDLNRSFPGSESGSLASQLADIFMREIACRSNFGLDLHSAAVHRVNLPQIRADIGDAKIRTLANAFAAPIVLHSNLRDGSLRQAAQEVGCGMLLYEAGEALRFDEIAIRIGVRGVTNVLRHLNMIPQRSGTDSFPEPVISHSSHWLRAPMGGVMRAHKALGGQVRAGERVAIVADPFGEIERDVVARADGIIIGRTNLPIVNRGDALYHVARVADADETDTNIEEIGQQFGEEFLIDDASII